MDQSLLGVVAGDYDAAPGCRFEVVTAHGGTRLYDPAEVRIVWKAIRSHDILRRCPPKKTLVTPELEGQDQEASLATPSPAPLHWAKRFRA